MCVITPPASLLPSHASLPSLPLVWRGRAGGASIGIFRVGRALTSSCSWVEPALLIIYTLSILFFRRWRVDDLFPVKADRPTVAERKGASDWIGSFGRVNETHLYARGRILTAGVHFWLLSHLHQPLCSVVRLVAGSRALSIDHLAVVRSRCRRLLSKPLVVYQALVFLFLFVACLTKVFLAVVRACFVWLANFYVVCFIIFFFLSVDFRRRPHRERD